MTRIERFLFRLELGDVGFSKGVEILILDSKRSHGVKSFFEKHDYNIKGFSVIQIRSKTVSQYAGIGME